MREEFEGEFDLVQSELNEFLCWTDYAETQNKTYRKILVPLDGSVVAADKLLSIVRGLLKPDGEAVLLSVIPPSSPKMVGYGFISAIQVEKRERSRALGFLNYFCDRMNESSGRWRCEVAVSSSVPDAITDIARREEADLIAMYTHGRTGLAKLIKGSIAEKVQAYASTEVRVVRPRELVAR